MISKLTPEQESKIPVYFKKWESWGYNTEAINREAAKKAVDDYYEYLGFEKPKYHVFLDSPMAMQMTVSLIKDKGLKTQLHSQLGDQLDSQLRSQLCSQLESQLDSHLNCHLSYQLSSQLNSQLESQLYSQLYSQLKTQLGSQLGSRLGSRLHSQLNSHLESQLQSRLYSCLCSRSGSQMYSRLYSRLHSQLESQLDSHLRSHLRSQMCSQLGTKYNSWESIILWWGGYYCFYDFILNELFPKGVGDVIGMDTVKNLAKETFAFIPFNGFVFHSDRPNTIALDDQKRLHCETGPSLEFRDTYSLYSLDGIRVNKDIIKCISEKEDPTKILELENAEQRLVGIKYFGAGNMLKHLNGKELDSGVLPNSGDLIYKLYSIELEGETEKLFMMQNPSEDKKHYEFVTPDCETIYHADMQRRGYSDYKGEYITCGIRS